MRALFVAPLPFVHGGGYGFVAGSVANLSDDLPNLVWRGATTSTFVIDLGPDPVAYDTVALIGTNLRASDTVTVRTLTDNQVITNIAVGPVPAWTGKKPKQLSAKTIIPLPELRFERFLAIDISAPGHPSGYAQVSRLVVGKAVSTLGIKFGAKINIEDNSLISKFPGGVSIDRYVRVPAWEISTSGITDQAWREDWFPLLLEVGSSSGLLFVRDEHTPETWQTDAIYGRITSKAYGEALGFDFWVFNGTIEAFAP